MEPGTEDTSMFEQFEEVIPLDATVMFQHLLAVSHPHSCYCDVQTPSDRITSPLEVTQHLHVQFYSRQWKKEYMNMRKNQVVVMYLDTDHIVRPVDACSLVHGCGYDCVSRGNLLDVNMLLGVCGRRPRTGVWKEE